MNEQENKIDELTTLLRKSIAICEKNRTLAENNYNNLRSQLNDILETGVEGSEEYKLEKEVNNALKLVFESGARMDAVINTISKILVTQMTNESRERAALSFVQGGAFNGKQIVNQPVNLSGLLEEE
jgi:hypothetical protein